jgi:hypothetical protein
MPVVLFGPIICIDAATGEDPYYTPRPIKKPTKTKQKQPVYHHHRRRRL